MSLSVCSFVPSQNRVQEENQKAERSGVGADIFEHMGEFESILHILQKADAKLT